MSEQLEGMIDRNGLEAVLDELANICNAKADHVDAVWRDTAASKDWTRVARKIEDVALLAALLGL